LRYYPKTDGLKFIALGSPTEVIDFQSKTPKLDSDGKGFYSLPVVAIADDEQEIITIKSSQFAKGITPGVTVKVVDLMISNWEFAGRHGTSYQASAIQLVEIASATVPAKSPTQVTA
jgi:hypothetical protein